MPMKGLFPCCGGLCLMPFMRSLFPILMGRLPPPVPLVPTQHILSNPKFPLTSVLTYCCQCPTTSNLTSSFYSPQCAPYSLCPLNCLYPLPYRAYTQCPLLSCLLCSVPLFSMSPFSRYPLPQCPLLLVPLLSVPPTLIDTSS